MKKHDKPSQPLTVKPIVVFSTPAPEKLGLIHKIIKFFAAAFSENGEPSSARILSGWLSVSSMALIWFMVRHAFYTNDFSKLEVWVGGMPAIIYALAAFAISPFGLAKISSIWKKDDKDKADPTKG
jgi:hypothetical protein